MTDRKTFHKYHLSGQIGNKTPIVATRMSLGNPQTLAQHQQTLMKLIETNQKYLFEKVKVAQVPKPSPYSHKIPSKTGLTQYNRNYHTISKIAAQNAKSSSPKHQDSIKGSNSPITSYASVYNIDYNGKINQKERTSSLRPSRVYRPSDAPSFHQSSYNRDFGKVARSYTQSAKRVEVKLMGGGKLSSDTTYNHGFKLKTIDSTHITKPVIHKNNKIFLQIANPASSSNYQEAFKATKAVKAEQSCKPKQQYQPIMGKVQHKTEYTNKFQGTTLQKKRDLELLSADELKKYVLGILDQ